MSTQEAPVIRNVADEPAQPKKLRPQSLVVEGEKLPDYDHLYDFTIKAEDHYKRMRIPITKGIKITGRILMPTGRVREDGLPALESVYLAHGMDLRKAVPRGVRRNVRRLAESQAWKKAKAMESFSSDLDLFGMGFDFGDSLLPSTNGLTEFAPVMGGPFSKQLYLTDYLTMQARCFESKNHNPYHKRAVEVITNYVFGKGVKIKLRGAKAQAAWDRYEEYSRFQARRKMDTDTLTWGGEIMTKKTFARGDEISTPGMRKMLRLTDGWPLAVQWDPSTVWEIVTDPRNINRKFYYHQQFPTQYQLVYKPEDKVSEYVIEDTPASQIIHTPINVVPGEKRGRSDLFSTLGWAKALRDYLTSEVAAAQMRASWVMRRKIKGNDADVQTAANDPNFKRVPPPASTLFENEAIETEFLAPPHPSGSGGDAVVNILIAQIAIGVGISPEELGVGSGSSGASRATALVKAAPSTKKYEDRQQVLEDDIEQEFTWWMQVCPELRGQDTSDRDYDCSHEVIWPTITTEDRSAKLKDLAFAAVFKAISHEMASTAMAGELDFSNYVYSETQESIMDEIKNKTIQLAMASLPPTTAPTPGGGPGGPGGPAKPGSQGGPSSAASAASFRQRSAGDQGA